MGQGQGLVKVTPNLKCLYHTKKEKKWYKNDIMKMYKCERLFRFILNKSNLVVLSPWGDTATWAWLRVES